MKLDGSTDISQVSGCTESDSEADHELEMRLYSELYFEPNPDFVPLGTQSPQSSAAIGNHSLNQCENGLILPSSALPLENVSNNLPDVKLSKEDATCAQVVSSTKNDLSKEAGGNCVELTNEKPSSPCDVGESSLEVLSPIKNIQVSTPAIGRYVFSTKNAQCVESNCSSKSDFTGVAGLSSTPINNIHSSLKRNHLLYSISGAKQVKNIESHCLKMPRKRIGPSINNDRELSKKAKIDEDVISVSSDNLDEDLSSCVSGRKCSNNSNVSSFLSELKRKMGKSSPKLNANAKKMLALKRRSTTFVCGDSSDSEESLPNGSSVCNFSLEVEGKDQDTSAKKTPQNKRVHWPMDYSSTRKNGIRTPSVPHWTPHMTSFYDSDVSEEYEIDHLHSTMPDDMMEWELEVDDFPDRPFGGRAKPRYFDQRQVRRCKRCRAYDHTLAQCKKLDYCHLCGDTSHYLREKCPRNCCFRCGGEYHTYCPNTCPWNRCEVCHNKGHVKKLCPDLWRRYAFTTSGSVPVRPSLCSNGSVKPPTCFSCGRSGHLGPDCAYRVQNYVVLHQEIQSFLPPTRNCLGMTVLTEDLQEQPQEVDELYGETVQRYTAVRASVTLSSPEVGYIIGKKGNLINALRRLLACQISIMEDENNPNSHQMWLKGTKLDEALRCILFLLNREADLTGVRHNMEQLDLLTGTKNFTQLWRRKMKEFNRSLRQMNEKKAKKEKAKRSSSNDVVYEIDRDSEGSIVYISDDEREKKRLQDVLENPGLQDKKLNLKRAWDDNEDEDDSYKDSDLELKIRANIASKKSKSIVDCEDSKYAAFDKLKTGRKSPRTALAPLDPQNCYSSDEWDSVSIVDPEIDDSATSDDDCEIESSDGDSDSVSDVSLDEMSLDSSMKEPNLFNLSISAASEKKLKSYKAKRFKTLLQSLPMGRKSLIHAVNDKLAKINVPINVENSIAKIRANCRAYRENRSEDTLVSIRDSLEGLGAYVLGCKGLGHGKNCKKEIQRRLSTLERSSSRVVSAKEREALAVVLDKIVSIDLGSLKYIMGIAERLKGEKENKTKGNTSVHSRLSFPKKSNNRQNQSLPIRPVHNQRKERNWKNLKNSRTFRSIHDIEHLEEQLTSGSFRHPQFPRKKHISAKKNTFRGKSTGRSPTLQNRRASRSPRDSRTGKHHSPKAIRFGSKAHWHHLVHTAGK